MGEVWQGRVRSALLAALIMAGTCHQAMAGDVGVRDLEVSTKERGAPLHATVWYPTADAGSPELIGDNAVFHGTAGLRGAAIAGGRFPLVVIYHGGFRAAPNVGTWLGSALAQDGFIAVVISPPPMPPGPPTQEVLSELWLRPADLSAAISAAEKDAAFAASIDPDKISAVGFFLGGYAVLAAAGARADATAYGRSCDGGAPAVDCAWFAKGSVDVHGIDAGQLERSNRDPRIRTAVIVDPELTAILTSRSLGEMSVPVHIVNLGREGTIAAAFDASGLASAIPKASYTVVPDAGPSSSFAECKPKGPAILKSDGGDESLCDDPGPTTRAQIHAKLASLIAAAVR